MTQPDTIGRALDGPADHRHNTEILDAITGISADSGHADPVICATCRAGSVLVATVCGKRAWILSEPPPTN